LLFVLTLGAVSFYSGFRPWLFRSLVGLLLLALTAVAMALVLWSLRSENISWKGSLSIVAFVTFIVITVIYVPVWLMFTYTPAAASGF
jgi:hypothetical protein